MKIFSKLLGSKPPVQRIRVCRECGMPLDEHKDWCAVLKHREAQGEAADSNAA